MDKAYSKWKSRTFILAVAWSTFVPLGLIASIVLSRYGIPSSGWLMSLITASGVIVTAFVGGEKWRKGKREGINNAKR